MEFQITDTAQQDLERFEEQTVDRITSKLEELENKLGMGFQVEKVVEKRLRGDWYPILQQRVGQYRLWMIEGEHVGHEDDIILLLRALTKQEQIQLQGVDVNPRDFL